MLREACRDDDESAPRGQDYLHDKKESQSMTRQQEGDEAMVKAVYPDAYINDDYSGSPSSDVGVFRKATKEDWPKNREIPISEFFATAVEAWADARSKLPATVHPEDETTLPALNVKCACGVTIEAVRSVHSPDECVNMDHYVLRISAEAERDALKAERDKYKSILDEQEQLVCGTMPTIWCRNGVEHPRDTNSDCDYCREDAMRAELATLKAQLNAVLGQETAQGAYKRGQKMVIDHIAVEIVPASYCKLILQTSIMPYTPPLKAGK